jgi:hypothetical protein
MKKFLFSLMALLAIAGTSTAQTENALTVADIELPQNGDAELVINFQLDTPDSYTGYSFNIEFPADLSFEMDTETGPTDVAYTMGDCYHKSHGVTANLDNGMVKVACLSTGSVPLTKQSGELLSFTVKAGDLTIGDTYTLKIKDILFVPVEGEKKSLADVTFTVKIVENDGRIKFKETSTKLPNFTSGAKANVTVFRTIKANQWSTLVLPFALTLTKAKAAFGDDVKMAQFDGFSVDYGEDETNVTPLAITINLKSYTIPARGSLAGGTPILIKTSKDIESFNMDEVTLVNTVTGVTKTEDETGTSGKLTGSFVKTVIPADGLFINNEQFWYSNGNTNVKAFRCWFELGAVLGKETQFGAPVYFSFDDGTTGINNIQRTLDDGAYYNLSGQRVETPAKGLYIKNGKKVIVK